MDGWINRCLSCTVFNDPIKTYAVKGHPTMYYFTKLLLNLIGQYLDKTKRLLLQRKLHQSRNMVAFDANNLTDRHPL